jgi:hypothetical protein
MYRLFTAALAGAAFIGLASVSANAAPFSSAPIEAQSEVQTVHGYHRSCRGAPNWRHRHQRDGDWVRCGRRYYRPSAPGITLYFGGRDYKHRHYRDRDHRRDGHRHRRHRD